MIAAQRWLQSALCARGQQREEHSSSPVTPLPGPEGEGGAGGAAAEKPREPGERPPLWVTIVNDSHVWSTFLGAGRRGKCNVPLLPTFLQPDQIHACGPTWATAIRQRNQTVPQSYKHGNVVPQTVKRLGQSGVCRNALFYFSPRRTKRVFVPLSRSMIRHSLKRPGSRKGPLQVLDRALHSSAGR